MKGILLINLGSPKDLEDESVKDYLKEFLSDDLVIDYPKVIQQILVNWLIVPNRYKKTKEAYFSRCTPCFTKFSPAAPQIGTVDMLAANMQHSTH